MEREWDVDGYFVGTVQDQPVNCRYRFRVREGRTEVQIGEENRQIAVSLDPLMEAMARHLISEFHFSRKLAACPAVGPDRPTTEGCRITLLHDYRCRDQIGSATSPPAPVEDRVAGYRR